MSISMTQWLQRQAAVRDGHNRIALALGHADEAVTALSVCGRPDKVEPFADARANGPRVAPHRDSGQRFPGIPVADHADDGFGRRGHVPEVRPVVGGDLASLTVLGAALAFRHFEMRAEHVDAREVIVTDRRHTQATPQTAETYERLQKTLPGIAEHSVVVMGGFIGSTESGVTTTGRPRRLL